MLKVTNVWPKKYVSGKLLGFADVQFSLDGSEDGAHMVWKGLKMFQGDGRIEVALPSKRDDKGATDDNNNIIWRDIIYLPKLDENPAGKEFLEHVRAAVEHAYNGIASGGNQKSKTSSHNTAADDDGVPF